MVEEGLVEFGLYSARLCHAQPDEICRVFVSASLGGDDLQHRDEFYMHKALNLAARARGRTSPNPLVGAVVVKDGAIVGQGFHQKAGTPHAEVHALQQAGELAKGATLYVTLEPCSHQGLTPPCAQAVIAAGIKRCVVATEDPNPLVNGHGLAGMKEAGIEIVTGVLRSRAERQNEVFLKYMESGLPFVILKTAMTLDGKIASSGGDSKWITSEPARQWVHRLRDQVDGIMVGIGTVLADDPLLNTRLIDRDGRDPVRLILDGSLDLPLTSRIADSSHEQPTLVFTSPSADRQRAREMEQCGMEVITVDGLPDDLNLEQVLQVAAHRKICSILVEGGGTVNASLLKYGLVDKLYWFIAPKIIGGRTAPSPVQGSGLSTMAEAIEVEDINSEFIGPDLLISGYIKKPVYRQDSNKTVWR